MSTVTGCDVTTVQQHSTGSTSTIAVSMSFSNKLTLKDWNNRMPTMDFLNLEGNKRRDKRLPFNTWNTSELQGNAVGFLFFYIWSARKSFSRNSLLRDTETDRISSTNDRDRDLFHQRWRTKQDHTANADICKKAVDHEFMNTGGSSAEFHGRTAKTANIGIAIRQIPYIFLIPMLGNRQFTE